MVKLNNRPAGRFDRQIFIFWLRALIKNLKVAGKIVSSACKYGWALVKPLKCNYYLIARSGICKWFPVI